MSSKKPKFFSRGFPREVDGEAASVRQRVDHVREVRTVVGNGHVHAAPKRIGERIAAYAVLGIVEACLRRMED